MDNLERLKEQIKTLFEGSEDKELITSLASINETLNAVEADTTALRKENKELLDDYKEVVKHFSFNVEQPETRTGDRAVPKFEDFLKPNNK